MFSFRLSAAAVAALVAAGALAAEKNLSLDNLVIALGAKTYRFPHVEIVGSSLPEGELSQLFSGTPAAIDARLAGFSASRVVIPSMSAEGRTGSGIARESYGQQTFENIGAGRVGLWRATKAESNVEAADGATQHFVWGQISGKGVDLRQAARVALEGRSDANEALKPIIDEEIVEKTRFEDRRDNLIVDAGRLSLTGVKGRPLATAWPAFLAKLDAFAADKPDPAMLRDILDALQSFEVATFEARDIAATGKGEPLGKPYSVKIGRIGVNKLAGAGASEGSIDNFALVASDGGRLSTGRVSLHDMQLAPMLSDGAWPRLAHIEMKGVDGDLPDPKTSAMSRVKFRLDNAVADLGNFVERMPTKFSARLDHAFVDLAARGETQSTAQFLALGYRELDVSASGAGEWREKSSDATLGPIMVDGKNMGALRITANLSNVSSAVFSSLPIVAKAAALAISIRDLDVTLEEGELINRVVADEAKRNKTSLEATRAEYAKAAATTIAALAGGGANARKIGDAVSAFILKPKRLHLHIAAPKGVNALDVLARRPGEILEAAEAEAAAER